MFPPRGYCLIRTNSRKTLRALNIIFTEEDPIQLRWQSEIETAENRKRGEYFQNEMAKKKIKRYATHMVRKATYNDLTALNYFYFKTGFFDSFV